MTKTFDQTTCLDPQTIAMIHQAAHYAIHEGMLATMDLQDLKQVLALDLIRHQSGFLKSRFNWAAYCTRQMQRKLKQLRSNHRSSQRNFGATDLKSNAGSEHRGSQRTTRREDLNGNQRAWRGLWSSFERWIKQAQELTELLTSQTSEQDSKPGPGRWQISTTMKQTERWTTDQAGNKRQGTKKIEMQQKRTWTPAPEKRSAVAAAQKKPTGPVKSKKRPAPPRQTESTTELAYQVQTQRKTA